MRTPHRYAVLWPYCHRLHDLLVLFATQVARSLRIRSRYLAMLTGEARRTQAQLHAQRPEAATSGCMPIRDCRQSVECTQIPILPMRTARSRWQPKAQPVDHGTGRARIRRSVALLLTTLLGIHTMDRRHCEAARRQQACDRWGSLLRSHARRGRKFGPKQPPHRLHAPARGPQAQGGARRGPHWRSSFRCRSAVCHPTLSTKCEKNAKVCRDSNPRLVCQKVTTYLSDQTRSHLNMRLLFG